MQQGFLTITEWARRREVTRQRAWQWVQAGRLPVHIIDGVQRIPESAPRPTPLRSGRRPRNPVVYA